MPMPKQPTIKFLADLYGSIVINNLPDDMSSRHVKQLHQLARAGTPQERMDYLKSPDGEWLMDIAKVRLEAIRIELYER